MNQHPNFMTKNAPQRMRTTACVTALLILMAGLDLACTPVEEATHVIVLGVDGLSPAGIQRATTPHFNRLLAEGAFTFKARAVLGTSSSQNWASMIMGAGPEQHGVTSNGWERDNHSIVPTTTGAEDLFPTIFGVLRQQRPEAKIATFYDWGGFGRLFEKSVLDQDVDGDGPDETLRQALAYITEEKPDFTFIHLDHVDHALHTEGHGSEDYYEAVEHTDVLLGELLDGLAVAGMSDRTILIVTADHGGVGLGHPVAIGRGAPGGGDAGAVQQVLGAPGNPVQRPPVMPGGNFAVGRTGLGQGALAGHGDDAFEPWPDALEAVEIDPGEPGAGNRAFAQPTG